MICKSVTTYFNSCYHETGVSKAQERLISVGEASRSTLVEEWKGEWKSAKSVVSNSEFGLSGFMR
jgi:hypothetical protein